jgi:tetratricopeptide (TPR) repeat protein
MTKEERYELYVAHTDHSLSASEELKLAELLQEPEYAREYEIYHSINKQFIHIEKFQDTEDAFMQTLKQAQQDYASMNGSTAVNTPKLGSTRGLKYALGLAAGLALCIVVYRSITKETDYSALYATNYQPIDLSAERGVENDSVVNIVSLYSAAKYAEAQAWLEQFLKSHSDNKLTLALANCYMAQSKFSDAENVLQHIINANDLYKEKAQWYLALVYVHAKQKDKAVALLSQFSEQHFYYNKAIELLKQLN